MSQQLTTWQPPTIAELTETLEQFAKDDVLNMTLSTEPPARWVKQHPMIKVKVPDANGNPVSVPLQYIPVDKQRLIAKRLFGMVQLEVRSTTQMFNSVCVTVRLHFKHPVTGEQLYMDGIGAVGVQTDAGATASDMSKIKLDGVMKAAPAAAAYAEKNAYDKLGRLFGGELQKDAIPFTKEWSMYADHVYNNPTLEDVRDLYDEKRSLLTPDEIKDIDRIITKSETTSYKKAFKLLQSK
jgi:hypothetical protein